MMEVEVEEMIEEPIVSPQKLCKRKKAIDSDSDSDSDSSTECTTTKASSRKAKKVLKTDQTNEIKEADALVDEEMKQHMLVQLTKRVQTEYLSIKQTEWLVQEPCSSCTKQPRCVCLLPSYKFQLVGIFSDGLESAYQKYLAKFNADSYYYDAELKHVNFKTMQCTKVDEFKRIFEQDSALHICHPSVLTLIRQEYSHCSVLNRKAVLQIDEPEFERLTDFDPTNEQHSNWTSRLELLDDKSLEYKLVDFHLNHDHLFKRSINKLDKQVGPFKVVKIEKVVNPLHAQVYQLQKQFIQKTHGQVSEAMLWYGTGTTVTGKVALDGIDIGYCKAGGGPVGKAIYLSTCPQEVNRHQRFYEGSNTYSMLYVKTLVGRRQFEPTRSMDQTRPQPDYDQMGEDGKPIPYDSIISSQNGVDFYALYKNSHVFVGYVVTYKVA